MAKWCCLLLLACGFQPHPPPLFTVVNQDPESAASYLLSAWGSSADNIFAGGENGRVFHYDGVLWTWVGMIPTNLALNAMWGRGPDDIFAVGSSDDSTSGVILHFDGESWQVALEVQAGMTSVWGIGDEVWAGGVSGTLYHLSGDGDWQAQPALPQNPLLHDFGQPVLLGFAGTSPSSVLAAGGMLSLFYYDGSSWTPIFRPNDGHFFLTAWAGASQFLVGGNEYAVWRFTPPDQLDLLSEEDAQAFALHNCWGSDPNHVVFVGEEGKVLTWDGHQVHQLSSGLTGDLDAVWGASPDDLWMVGASGTIVHAQHLF